MRAIVLTAMAVSGLPLLVGAQESSQEAAPLTPTHRSIGVGVTRVGEDGESSWRLGLFWYASDRFVPGLTANWGLDDNVEPELRWFPRTRSSPFFISGSVIYKQRGLKRFGGAVAAGFETYVNRALALSISLGWESVFGGTHGGPHWFRVQGGLTIILPFMARE